MEARFHIAECRVSYARILQTSAMEARLHIAECRVSYAKIMKLAVLWGRQASYLIFFKE